MVELHEFKVMTHDNFEMLDITPQVEKIVAESRVKDGVCFVITSHTTTGITVQENLPCLYTDIEETFDRLVPWNLPYAHNHFLLSYGSTGGNAPGHLRSLLTGNHCVFPVMDRKLVRGAAQTIFLCEYDRLQIRRIYVQLIGEGDTQ